MVPINAWYSSWYIHGYQLSCHPTSDSSRTPHTTRTSAIEGDGTTRHTGNTSSSAIHSRWVYRDAATGAAPKYSHIHYGATIHTLYRYMVQRSPYSSRYLAPSLVGMVYHCLSPHRCSVHSILRYLSCHPCSVLHTMYGTPSSYY